MKRFGLTGNTGTGKTTAADMLRARGIPVVDADRIARAVVEPGEPALAEIAATFGSRYLDDQGALRRQELGRLVFGDREALRRLEAITHPRIAERAAAELAAYEAQGAPFAVYDSAILVESGMAGALDGLIVVSASPERQRERIMARDRLSREDADQRIGAQMPLAEKVARADLVIDNDADLDTLAAEVERAASWMASRAKAG